MKNECTSPRPSPHAEREKAGKQSAKREWNTVPAEAVALRETLPKISADTRERLIAWACRQPDVMSWLLRRTAAYWGVLDDGVKGEMTITEAEDLHQLTDATAALDLLEWQSGCRGKAAVEWLDGLDEAGVAPALCAEKSARSADATTNTTTA